MDLKLLTLAMVMVIGFTSCGATAEDKKVEIECIPVKVKGDEGWSFMDRKGNLVLQDCLDPLTTVVANHAFVMRQSDGTFSLYELDGDEANLIESGFTSIGGVDAELIPAAKPGEGVFVMDSKGKRKFRVGPYEGHEVLNYNNRYCDGLLLVQFDDLKYGFYDTKGKLAFPPLDAFFFQNFENGYAGFKDNKFNKLNVIDHSGKIVWKQDPSREEYAFINNGIIKCSFQDKPVLVLQRPTGETVYTHNKEWILESIEAWDDDICVLRRKNPKTGKTGCGVIDYNGNVLVDFDYDKISLQDDYVYCTDEDAKTKTIYNRNGEFKIHITDVGSVAHVDGFGILARSPKPKANSADQVMEAAIFRCDGNGGTLNTMDLEDLSARSMIGDYQMLFSPLQSSIAYINKNLLQLINSRNYLRATYDDTQRTYYTWGKSGFDKLGHDNHAEEIGIGAPAVNFACLIDTIECESTSALLFDYLIDNGVIRVFAEFDGPVSNGTFNGCPIIEKSPRLVGYMGLMGTFTDIYPFTPGMLPHLQYILTKEAHQYTVQPKLRGNDTRPYLLMKKGSELLCLSLCRVDEPDDSTNWIAFFITDTAHRDAIEHFLNYVWGEQ